MVEYLANKVRRSHKAMLISEGLNPETVYLDTFVGHYERSETTDNIARENFSASDKYIDTKRKKKRPKFKEKNGHGKKYH